MNRRAIEMPGVPTSGLPFSPALEVGPWLFVSGQASVDDEGQIVPGTFREEMTHSFDNVVRILAAAGLSLADVVQVRGYVGRPEIEDHRYAVVSAEVFDPLGITTIDHWMRRENERRPLV